jgi:hypothetical protein
MIYQTGKLWWAGSERWILELANIDKGMQIGMKRKVPTEYKRNWLRVFRKLHQFIKVDTELFKGTDDIEEVQIRSSYCQQHNQNNTEARA